MKQKELIISIPEGYEIDKEKSTFEKIIFKPVDSKIRSWEEYRKTSIEGKWAILCGGRIDQYTSSNPIEVINPMVIFDSKEEAAAFYALAKLRLLHNQWVGDWEPEALRMRYAVINSYLTGITSCQTCTASSLDFPTKEMAEDFIETFSPLLEQAELLI